MARHYLFGRRSKSAPRPVSLDRAADLAADGIAYAKPVVSRLGGFPVCFVSIVAPSLQDQAGSGPLLTGGGNAQKLPALLQPQHDGGLDNERRGRVGQPRSATPSRGQTFPPFGASAGKDPAAANSRHAPTKSMPTLADKVTGLKSALHGRLQLITSPLYTVLPKRSQRR